MTAGVIIDNYKQATFEIELSKRGFAYEVLSGPLKGTKNVKIIFLPSQILEVKQMIKEINTKATKSK